MIKKVGIYALLGLMLLFLASCETESTKNRNTWNFEANQDPLSFNLIQTVVYGELKLSGGNNSALFYITGQDTQHVTELKDVSANEDGNYRAVFSTTDRRTATVSLRSQPEGSLRLQFTVEPDSGISRKGLSIAVDEDEAFYGLMERVVDGDQDLSWQPGITESLDLRGQKLSMFVKPTVSIYEPFYVSSNGYGVFVEGTWPGEYDMASTDSDEVSFSFEGPQFECSFHQRS